MAHLKTINAPKIWPVKKKTSKFVARPSSGPHPYLRGITVDLLLKEVMDYARTTREVKRIINNKQVMIDKIPRTDHRFPVGLMDLIEIPKTNECYRIIINNKKKFVLNKLKESDSSLKPLKIIGKKILRKNRLQLNSFDGRNIIVDKDDYKVGDTIIYDLKNKKIASHLKLEKGSKVYIMDGKYQGRIGVLESIKKEAKEDRVSIKSKEGDFETLKKFIFVINENVI